MADNNVPPSASDGPAGGSAQPPGDPGYGTSGASAGYGAPGQTPGYNYAGQAPGYAYVDPYAKSKIVAGLLGIFLGGFGIHRFYLGYNSIGITQIIVTIVTCGIGSIWGFVEGILYLVGASGFTTDAEGRPLKD